MSDEPREAQRKMEKVFLCDDIWFDCLPFLSRPKVGLAFALVSDRFDRLADAHLGSKKRPWTLGDLMITRKLVYPDHLERVVAWEMGQIQSEPIIRKNWLAEDEQLLLADGPLPDNVIGFKRIYICYVDHRVIDFLRRIRRLFQPKNNGNDDGIGLQLFFNDVRSWDVFFDSIWQLISPSAITKLYLPRENTFNIFRRRTSPTFLLDWANVRMLVNQLNVVPFGNGENGQLLWKWLHTPREDGKPKLLRNYGIWSMQTVQQLKTKFLNAQNAVSFIIFFEQCYAAEPFELNNFGTGERMKFQKFTDINWLLERGPIEGRDAAQWTEWVGEAMDGKHYDNLLHFSFEDDKIGSLDEIAGTSGQQLQQK